MSVRLLLVVLPCAVQAQFGGAGYKPPAPQCKPFTCSKGEKPLRKKGYKAWSYGCPDSGANFMTMGSNFDPSDPMGSMRNGGQKNFNKCCLEHDACLQTCGMTSQACHEAYQKCSTKVCKGDQNCGFQAQMAQILSAPVDDKLYAKENKKGEDPMCRTYDRMQKESCDCVEKDSWDDDLDKRIKTFYKLYNPEKLDDKGEIKDLESVKTKWKGKFPEMFWELTKKYKDKAIDIKIKPKPPPYKPPPKDGEDDSEPDYAESSTGVEDQSSSGAEDTAEDENGSVFQKELQYLEKSKKAAAADEDYERAEQLVGEIKTLKKNEILRLNKEKSEAIDAEDYKKAKLIKARIDAMQPKEEL